MSKFGRAEFSDQQVEALLTGHNDDTALATLSTTLDEIRSLRDLAPAEPPADLIAQAVALARVNRPTSPARPLPPRRSWKLAPAAVAVALAITTFMPLAAVANAAVPGDNLFALDLFLERFGIGAGGLSERLTEVETLRDRGQVDAAVRHLTESVMAATEREASENQERVDTLVDELSQSSGEDNPNKGPGNNSGNGNTESGEDNPNKGPGNNSGNDNGNQGDGQTEDNPNMGPGNNSGNHGNGQENQGNTEDNPNKGPGNNSGNDNGNQGDGQTEDNPNKGSGNNSGNEGNGQGNGGEDNPNKGPGNNSGNGNGQGNP